MKFFATTVAIFSVLFSSAVAAPSASISVSYDPKYDVAGSSLNTVACSDGEFGLVTKYPTFGNIPSFARIGGAPTIAGWGSANCGKCYQLHYKSASVDKSIYMTAIDAAPGGFNIAQAAMNELTNNRAVELGRIQATYTEVDKSLCGL